MQTKTRLVMNPNDISVAILYPGNRVDKVNVPLQASDMDVAIEPYDAYARDIVLCDNADRDLAKEVLRKKTHSAKLVYRMRGDIFYELSIWDMNIVKMWLARHIVLPNVDGVIAVSERMADKYQTKTGIEPVGHAAVPKQVGNWPDSDHTDTELRILTLTNPNYKRKIAPLVEWADRVNSIISDVGGRWHIAGKGKYANWLRKKVADYENVAFVGYVDAHEYLHESNLMIHASRLDAFPNSILEGMASQLPVLTNDWVEFENHPGPVDVCYSMQEVETTLRDYTEPQHRQVQGEQNETYVAMNHTPEYLADQYETYFSELVNHAR